MSRIIDGIHEEAQELNPLAAQALLNASPVDPNAKAEKTEKEKSIPLDDYSSLSSSSSSTKAIEKAMLSKAKAPAKKETAEDFWSQSSIAPAKKNLPLDLLPNVISEEKENEATPQLPAKKQKKHLNPQYNLVQELAIPYSEMSYNKIYSEVGELDKNLKQQKLLVELKRNLPEKGKEPSEKASKLLSELEKNHGIKFSKDALKDPAELRVQIDDEMDICRTNIKYGINKVQTKYTELTQVLNIVKDSLQDGNELNQHILRKTGQ